MKHSVFVLFVLHKLQVTGKILSIQISLGGLRFVIYLHLHAKVSADDSNGEDSRRNRVIGHRCAYRRHVMIRFMITFKHFLKQRNS